MLHLPLRQARPLPRVLRAPHHSPVARPMGLQEMLQVMWHPALTGAGRHQVGSITCHWVTCKDRQSPAIALSAAAITSKSVTQQACASSCLDAVALSHFKPASWMSPLCRLASVASERSILQVALTMPCCSRSTAVQPTFRQPQSSTISTPVHPLPEPRATLHFLRPPGLHPRHCPCTEPGLSAQQCLSCSFCRQCWPAKQTCLPAPI